MRHTKRVPDLGYVKIRKGLLNVNKGDYEIGVYSTQKNQNINHYSDGRIEKVYDTIFDRIGHWFRRKFGGRVK